MAGSKVIDRGVLADLLESLGGDTDFLAELLEAFYDDSPRQLAAMGAALAAGNAEDLRRAAHSLKSNSANFGALALSRSCKELEEMGKAGMLDGAAGQIAQVAVEYDGARAALEEIQRES
jgi:two-component system sensor histidine kinase/response regulator